MSPPSSRWAVLWVFCACNALEADEPRPIQPSHVPPSLFQPPAEELPAPSGARPTVPAVGDARRLADPGGEAQSGLEPRPIQLPTSLSPRVRPQLGVRVAKNGQGGVTVLRVRAGSPAAAAGLRLGEFMATIDGQPIRSFGDLRRALQKKDDGDTVTVGVKRGGRVEQLTVKLWAPGPDE